MAIINRFGDNDAKSAPDTGNNALVSWIMGKVTNARDTRDEMYGDRWREYTRLWRGFWSDEDKNRNSERSKIISPALQQAIEMTVSEMEEAIFARKAWFDIDDDIADEDKEDAIAYRDQLLEDFDLANVKSAVSQVLLNGAIYGTGIAKINVVKKMMPGKEGETSYIQIELDPIRPDEFIIDPSARNVDEALFCAHELIKPLHGIKEKQAKGIYLKGRVGTWSMGEQRSDPTGLGNRNVQAADEGAMILEYFGKVPANLLPDGEAEGGMVEAMVTIANENVLLRAVETPFTYKDRPILAYQHDTVPGEFWGRGVAEKGYNPQKALDAEMRARMDALALVTSPMMGADVTRLPRNPDLRVRPGKMFLTRGRPSEILEPVGFMAPNIAAQFQQTGDLERMVQMGTGALDSATPNNISRRNETMGGMGMMQSGFIKRSKRTMYNVERHFIGPLVRKSLWRYMQFAEDRYPMDMKFKVNSTMGITAKEVENAQLIQMLSFTPPESPAHSIMVQAIFENAVSDYKADLHRAIQAMNKPPTPEEQQQAEMAKQMAFEMQREQLRQIKAQNDKLEAEAALARAKTEHEYINADLEDEKINIQAANAAIGAEKVRVSRHAADAAHAKNSVALEAARNKPQPQQ